MKSKKNNVLQLEAYEDNIRLKVKEMKKKMEGKKTKKEYYNNANKILNKNTIPSIDNRIKLLALKEVVNNIENSVNNTDYPELTDLDLSQKLYYKKEFHQYRIKKTEITGNLEENLKKLSKKKCDFTGIRLLSDTQKMLRNFISPYTPYNGVLIYHGVGVGKTCTSITIAEGLKEIIKNNKKKIYVLINPSIQENFKNEIIDKGLIEKNIMKAMTKCTGDSYFRDGLIQKGLDRNKNMRTVIRNILSDYYEFYGYNEFASKVMSIIANIKKKSDRKNLQENIKRKLKEYFSDSMIIIDEAHNISKKDRDRVDDAFEENFDEFNDDADNADDANDANYANDANKDLGNKNNDKSEKLDNKTKGDKVGRVTIQILKNILINADNLKLILLTATPMYNQAYEIIDLINLLLLNDNRSVIKQSDFFDSNNNFKESKTINFRKKINGYISYLRSENPINFPFKIYPLEYEGKYINNSLYPKLDNNNERLGNDIIKHLKVIGCEMQGLQLKVYQKYYFEEDRSKSFVSKGLQISNIVFAQDLNIDEIASSSNHYGPDIFSRVLKIKEANGILSCKINEEYKDNFDLENLKFISSKFYTFISGIQNNMPKGIVFIYSQFKSLGVYTLAILLELIGITNYSGNNILKNRNIVQRYENGKPLKYLMKTGDSSKDFDNYKDNDEVNNMDGSLCKFILGTKAASEGINIYNVREIHIMDPWFHINRIEQINGRGIRNCSHKFLDLDKRNVTIYMYAAIEPKELKRESVDLRMYKISEKKAVNMGKVQQIVKSSSIDCYLNQEGNYYLGDVWNKNINIIDARGNKRKINLEDKPFTDICNYSEEKKCKRTECYSTKKMQNIIKNDTYIKEFSTKDIEYYQELIKDIFSNLNNNNDSKIIFNLQNLLDYVSENDKMNLDNKDEILYFALDNLIKREIEIKDKFNRPGRLINIKNYYIFQPNDLPIDIPLVYRKLEYKKKINKIILKNLNLKRKVSVKKNKKSSTKKISLKKDRELDLTLTAFCRIALDTDEYFYKENAETKKKSNLKQHLDFIDNLGLVRDIIIIEYQYDNLLMTEKEFMIKLIILKLGELIDSGKISYDLKLLKDLVDINSLNLDNLILNNLTEEIRNLYKVINIEEESQLVDNKIKYLIKYCLYNHLEFNRQEGFEKNMDKNYLGYRRYISKTISRKVESKLLSFRLIDGNFIPATESDKTILEFYHKTYKLSKYKDRDLADIYGIYFDDAIKLKIVNNNEGEDSDKRTIRPGVGCRFSTTNSKLLIPLMKTLKDGKRLLDDGAKQKYKCLVIELFLRFKEYMSQRNGGPLYFYNQGLHGIE